MIAIKELRAAREQLKGQNPGLRIRCLFIEKNKESCLRLREHLSHVKDISIHVINGELETSVDQILQFASGNSKTFSFFFIDPTGWSGYSLRVIAPILRHPASEVLINFMTKDIIRFIDHDRPADIESFNELFGGSNFRQRWKLKTGLDREDSIVETYGSLVKEVGNFSYVAPTVILHPLHNRTHFHLIYATRHIAGLQVFRNEAERKAHETQQSVRHQASLRKEEGTTGQLGLFSEPIGPSYLDELTDRYQARAKARMHAIFRESTRINFDDLEGEILQFPLVHTQVLKGWLEQLRKVGKIQFEGLATGARTLSSGKGHTIVVVSAK